MGTARIRQEQQAANGVAKHWGPKGHPQMAGMAGIPPSYHPVVGIKTCTQGVFCFFEKKPACGRSLMDVGMYEY